MTTLYRVCCCCHLSLETLLDCGTPHTHTHTDTATASTRFSLSVDVSCCFAVCLSAVFVYVSVSVSLFANQRRLLLARLLLLLPFAKLGKLFAALSLAPISASALSKGLIYSISVSVPLCNRLWVTFHVCHTWVCHKIPPQPPPHQLRLLADNLKWCLVMLLP